MAYVLLPPAGGVLLLITEHKSDYVRFIAFPVRVLEEAKLTCVCRFHAWQSSLLFAFMVVGILLVSCVAGGKRKLIFCAIGHTPRLFILGVLELYATRRRYRDDTLLEHEGVPRCGYS